VFVVTLVNTSVDILDSVLVIELLGTSTKEGELLLLDIVNLFKSALILGVSLLEGDLFILMSYPLIQLKKEYQL